MKNMLENSAMKIYVQFRKYPYSPHRGDWNFLGVGGSARGVGGLEKNPFRGGDMDILWNYTIEKNDFFPLIISM